MQFAKQVKRRRGTAAENAVFTGAEGEIVVDLTNHKLRVHDGTTVGGFGAVTDTELASAQNTINNSIATKATKASDFMTPVTSSNKGATKAEVDQLRVEINTAANSGALIGSYWFGKTESSYTPPLPTLGGQNYFDFTTNTPYTANSDLSGWTAGTAITAPTVVSQIQITSKFWNIPEQDGQQGGTAYWSPTQQAWSYSPKIISFDSPNLSGIPTAPALTTTSPNNQIVNRESAKAIARANTAYQKVESQALTDINNIDLTSETNIILLTQDETEIASATINITSSVPADECITCEIRIESLSVPPQITWSDNITWLIDSEQSPVDANATSIFVVQVINGRIIANFGGAYANTVQS